MLADRPTHFAPLYVTLFLLFNREYDIDYLLILIYFNVITHTCRNLNGGDDKTWIYGIPQVPNSAIGFTQRWVLDNICY